MAWNGKLKVTAIWSCIASVLGVFVLWSQLGWPVPAFTNQVEAADIEVRQEMNDQFNATHDRIASLEQFNLDTRAIVLGFEWERLFKLIESYENRQSLTQAQENLLVEWKIKLRRVEQQLEALQTDSR